MRRHANIVPLTRLLRNKTTPRVLTAGLLVACLASGCVSVDISRSKIPGSNPSTGTLAVSIFETAADARRDAPSPRAVVSELVRSDVSPEQTIYRGTETRWTREGLLPGRYRLTALAVRDDQGKESPLPNQDSERFRIHAGELVRATILLKEAPKGAIAGLSAGVVALIVAAIVISSLAFFDREPSVAPQSNEDPRVPGVPFARPVPHPAD